MVIEFYYHPLSPPSQVVWMVLEGLGLQYKATLVNILSGEQFSEEYDALNPVHQVPTLKDGDFVLTQSRAIVIYLCNKYEPNEKKEKLYPTEITEIAKFNSALFRDLDNYQTIYSYIDANNVYIRDGTGPRQDLLPKAKAVFEEVDTAVFDKTYIFGDRLTVLDFCVLSTIYFSREFDVWGNYPNLKKYRDGLATNLDYFEKCLEIPAKQGRDLYRECCEKSKAQNQ